MRLIRFIILYLLDRFVKVKNFEVSKQNIVPILYNVINKNTSHDGSTPAERNQTGDILNAFVVMNFHRYSFENFLKVMLSHVAIIQLRRKIDVCYCAQFLSKIKLYKGILISRLIIY